MAVVALVCWLGVSALSAVQSSLRDGTRDWSDLLAGNLLAWLPWLVFAWPIGRLSRARIQPRRGVHLALAHFGLATGCATLYLLYLTLFRTLPRPAAMGAWHNGLQEVAGEHLFGALLVYAMIAITSRLTQSRSEQSQDSSPPASGIAVRQRGRTRFIAPPTIDWVSAEGSYARLHVGDHTVLLRRSLSRLASELEPYGFVRVHRSAVVNVGRVREVESLGHGDGTLVLDSGATVRLSRTYRGAFDAAVDSR